MLTKLLRTALGTRILHDKRLWASGNNLIQILPVTTPRSLSTDQAATWKGLYEELLEEEHDEVGEECQQMANRYFHLAATGHQVLLIQPYAIKGPHYKIDTTPSMMMEESIALVRTLNWRIVESLLVPLPSLDKKYLFPTEMMTALTESIQKDLRITAVFISLYQLLPTQRTELEACFKVPVIDRYSLVLHIFQQHARTTEARLQILLAEIPYIRQRLIADYEVEQNNKHSKGNLGEKVFEVRRFALKKLTSRINAKIDRLRTQRQKLRAGRQKQGVPTVAVVGYTNCGKTTLIKQLTGSKTLEPKDQLFATLDVTCHAGTLPSNLTCVFVDTVGFISDIPTELIASFSATLEDALQADLILHVRDISHPDTEHQNTEVLNTLAKLRLPHQASKNILTVANKIDKIPVSELRDLVEDGLLPISATDNIGLDVLLNRLDRSIMQVTNRVKHVFRVKTGSEEQLWLNKHAGIVSTEVAPTDSNYSMVTAILTPADLARFRASFLTA